MLAQFREEYIIADTVISGDCRLAQYPVYTIIYTNKEIIMKLQKSLYGRMAEAAKSAKNYST